MKINPNTSFNYYPNAYVQRTEPNFKAAPVQTLTHCNIGMMPEGIIGKIRVFKNGKETFLDVDKIFSRFGNESYLVKDKIGNIIGEMDLVIKKYTDYDRMSFPEDPSHVFVQFVCNHSNKRGPNAEYYTEGLEEYKGIGTRLLQIAQRRSDETGCNGNLQLFTKRSAIGFYEKMGFVEIPDLTRRAGGSMYLPPEAKEPLSRMYGGL